MDLAAQRFGLSGGEELSCIGGFQNFVYEYLHKGRAYILRLTPELHRTSPVVQAELDWIMYLAQNGVSASNPIFSINGQYAETIETPDMHYCRSL
jgi:Ser/Thr protein kinase RdoA (MazF antagonist)